MQIIRLLPSLITFGLTVEAVSRAVAQLRSAGVLDLIGNTQREIMIVDRQQLASFWPTKLDRGAGVQA
ncbi:helix-turn-helix domain-containing protein [Bradyrhizobium sp. CCBAU 11430]|uniref:helix-turn-helix domain-containing protein n=1 Tax=Bradyrhizobium sp. CCBAU 11430 TaxID=1630881 RepID=UPI002305378C|nr:helix-turn-helix domain-containing protein [Bradyrhizobium sp. CCBAU 11430]